MAQLARQNGLLALEEKANELDDMFFKQGIMLIVDATEPEEVRTLLESDVEAMLSRHEDCIGIYDTLDAKAPAFGMIGTLVGLVNMLKGMNMDEGGAGDIGLSTVSCDGNCADYDILRLCTCPHDILADC